MIMPFRQLGFDITFYSMGSDLNTPSGLPESADNSVLLFAHYFGKRNHPLIKYVEEQRNNTHSSFKVIEDCVQTCASSAYGKHGDYIVHSLRKFLPVPDGGIIESDEPIPSPLLPPDESFISEKILSKLVRGVNGEAEEFLDLYSHSEMKIVNEITPRECSHLTRLLLQKLDFEEAGKHRIRFWHLLAKALKQVSIVTPLFSRLGEDETPLLFPVLVKKKLRDPLRSFLAQHSLYCPVHWVLSETSLHSQFPVDCDLSQSLLSIPIDQRVSEETLQKLVTTLNAFDPEAL